MPRLANQTPVADRKSLAVKPFKQPSPTRDIGIVWWRGSEREKTVDAVADVMNEIVGRKSWLV